MLIFHGHSPYTFLHQLSLLQSRNTRAVYKQCQNYSLVNSVKEAKLTNLKVENWFLLVWTCKIYQNGQCYELFSPTYCSGINKMTENPSKSFFKDVRNEVELILNL